MDDTIYYDLAMIAQQEGRACVLRLLQCAVSHAVKANPLVIKPNLEELEMTFGQTFGTQEAIIAKAEALCKGGVENVLVSLGGAIAVCGGDVFRLYTDDLPVYNTVGARCV